MLSRDLLQLLSDGEWHSGASLGQHFSVSRAAIWKQIESAREYGLEILADRAKGYRLADEIQLCNASEIVSYLEDPAALHLHTYLSLESTNDTALALLHDQSASLPFAVIADHQTGGRGRRGRHWVSPLGRSVYLSLAWSFSLGLTGLAGLSLVIALAMRRALLSLGYDDIDCKWPNDLQVDNKKLAGILLEVQGEADGPCQVVIGIGLNVTLSSLTNDVTSQIDQPWTDLYSLSGRVDNRNLLLATLLNELCAAIGQFQAHGFKLFIEEWMQVDCMLGESVNLLLGAESIVGIHKGISEQGGIILDTSTGVKTFNGGEVSLRRELDS